MYPKPRAKSDLFICDRQIFTILCFSKCFRQIWVWIWVWVWVWVLTDSTVIRAAVTLHVSRSGDRSSNNSGSSNSTRNLNRPSNGSREFGWPYRWSSHHGRSKVRSSNAGWSQGRSSDCHSMRISEVTSVKSTMISTINSLSAQPRSSCDEREESCQN